ncbi:hypothetical protein UG55_102042 [Frankia sp. EI5c]|nr:hypothetical protein UG55_102042 [Frankia sp. EI5c]
MRIGGGVRSAAGADGGATEISDSELNDTAGTVADARLVLSSDLIIRREVQPGSLSFLSFGCFVNA